MIETEILVLALLMDAPKKSTELLGAMSTLDTQDFTHENAKLFGYLRERFKHNQSILQADLVLEPTANQFLELIVRDGGSYSYRNLGDYVAQLKTENHVTNLVDYHTQCVKTLSSKEFGCTDKLNQMQDIPLPQIELSFNDEAVSASEAVKEFIDNYHKPSVEGERTGFLNLDDALFNYGNGIPKGSLVGIVADTKQGKSTLATGMLINRATKETNSLVFSMEITAQEMISNMISQTGSINRGQLMRREQAIGEDVAETCFRLLDKNFEMYDKPNMTLDFIVSMSKLKAQQMPIKTILVDYLTLIRMPSNNKRSDENWAYAVTTLRQLAKELNCIVILVSQANRDSAKRQNPRPKASDIRDTSQLAYDCHLLLGTYIDKGEVYGRPKQMEVNIILNRNGSQGDIVYFDFEGGYLVPKTKQEGEAYNSLLSE